MSNLQLQIGCLNLLTKAIILWNSVYMWEALKQLKKEGYPVNEEDLKHIWPTRFEHTNCCNRSTMLLLGRGFQFNTNLSRLLRHSNDGLIGFDS